MDNPCYSFGSNRRWPSKCKCTKFILNVLDQIIPSSTSLLVFLQRLQSSCFDFPLSTPSDFMTKDLDSTSFSLLLCMPILCRNTRRETELLRDQMKTFRSQLCYAQKALPFEKSLNFNACFCLSTLVNVVFSIRSRGTGANSPFSRVRSF